jgi:hypothetical protein
LAHSRINYVHSRTIFGTRQGGHKGVPDVAAETCPSYEELFKPEQAEIEEVEMVPA